MKTKITSFLSFALIGLLALSTSAFADMEAGFYEKDHIRGFISIGGAYNGMRSEFQDYVNTMAFYNGRHIEEVTTTDEEGNEILDTIDYKGNFKYSKFENYFLGMHVNVGAQYKQFLTWFSFNFMLPQVSERSSDTFTGKSPVYDADGNVVAVNEKNYPLYDVEWYSYGIDWMFGWKFFNENSIFNLIPAVGFGMNLINFHFASDFDLRYAEEPNKWDSMRDRVYSTFATTVNAELEARLQFSRFSVGAYGGYRFIRYNEMKIESRELTSIERGDTDACGDTWYAGLRLTWLFLSQYQIKQNHKL